MATVEKISIAIPREMLSIVHQAVDSGEYASSSEVVRAALRDWTDRRALRKQEVETLHRVWQQAVKKKMPGVATDEVLNRLERKYRVLANSQGAKR